MPLSTVLSRSLFASGLGCVLLFASSCQKSIAQQDTARLITRLEEERNIQTCDGTNAVRADIAEALGDRGDPRAIEPLISVLNSPDEDVLSRGASGCEPGSQKTYHPAIEALGKFGPQAQDATPRLVEMLQDPETSFLTHVILEALVEIEGEKALSLIVPVYSEVAASTEYTPSYLNTFTSFEEQLSDYGDVLIPAFQRIDIDTLNEFGKADLAALLIAYDVSHDQEPLKTLLDNPDVLFWLRDDLEEAGSSQ